MTEPRRAAAPGTAAAQTTLLPRPGQESGREDPGDGIGVSPGYGSAHHGRAEEPRQAGQAEGQGRAGTRQRIQSVALQLFAEQGYDKTSLREIAERLGVTKAALYYHFKSKDDIVTSLVEDFFGQIDELIAWGETLPRTPSSRAEVLSRYFSIVAGGSEVFRMLQQNQASVNSLAHAKSRERLFRERMFALVDLLSEPDAPLADQLRAAVALSSVSFGCMFFADRANDRNELREAVLGIAFGLTGARFPGTGEAASG